jgi:hypothetical protein
MVAQKMHADHARSETRGHFGITMSKQAPTGNDAESGDNGFFENAGAGADHLATQIAATVGRNASNPEEAFSVVGQRRQKMTASDEDAKAVVGHRHGSRERSLTWTFGKTQITVPRARLERPDGTTAEWRSGTLRACQRRTVAADALIAGSYLAGTNTCRVPSRAEPSGAWAARARRPGALCSMI